MRGHDLVGGNTGFNWDSDLLWPLGQLFYFPGFLFSVSTKGWKGDRIVPFHTLFKVYFGQDLMKLCFHFFVVVVSLLITILHWHVCSWK